MRGRTTPRLRTALVGAAASVALVAGVGFVATTPDVSTDDIHLVQAEGAALVQGQEVNIDLKKLVEAQIGQEVPEGTTLKLNGLPEGLKQDGWNITGTPTESGLYNVRVEVNSGGQTSTQEVQLMVAAPDGEEPNAPTTDTEQGAEGGTDGAEGEKSGESEKPGESEPTTGAGDKTESKDAESGNDSESATTTTTPSSEVDKTNDKTDAESGASDEQSSTPSSTPATTTDSESNSETATDDSQETSSPEFPTEDEAFGEDGTDTEADEGTEIDLDEAAGSLTDGMLGGSGSLEGSTGGEDGVEECETGDLTAGLEKFLPVVVGEQDDSGMITSIITSVLGSLLPTVLNTASSGNGSVCDAGGATGSLLESAAGFADAQQGEGADVQTAGAQAAGAQAAGGTTTLDSLLGGDGTQLIELMQLASGIMEQVGSPADGAR